MPDNPESIRAMIAGDLRRTIALLPMADQAKVQDAVARIQAIAAEGDHGQLALRLAQVVRPMGEQSSTGA